jgi:V8-like Glu-specific endopeptidase
MPESNVRGAAARYLRKLSHGVPAASAGAVESATAESLTSEHAEEAHARAVETIEQESGRKLDPASREKLERIFLGDGKEAISRLKNDGAEAELTERHEDALEAIVEVDGSRPTLIFSDEDRIDLEDKTLGQWKGVAKKFVDQISKVASAVGRVDLNGSHQGTGFVITDGLILTNRHVLQALATQKRSGEWEFMGEPSITFDANPEKSRKRQLKIRKKVIRTGTEPIDRHAIDYRKLDFAVLECETSDEKHLPEPLALESDADKVAVGRPVFTIGYPAKPGPGTYESDVLQKLFQYRYGVKRFATGEIDRGFGSSAEGTGETVFAHDSTTLGGNSGSCVVDLGNDGRLVVGLHFAGAPKKANYAHANARLHETLADLGLAWKEWIPPV